MGKRSEIMSIFRSGNFVLHDLNETKMKQSREDEYYEVKCIFWNREE